MRTGSNRVRYIISEQDHAKGEDLAEIVSATPGAEVVRASRHAAVAYLSRDAIAVLRTSHPELQIEEDVQHALVEAGF